MFAFSICFRFHSKARTGEQSEFLLISLDAAPSRASKASTCVAALHRLPLVRRCTLTTVVLLQEPVVKKPSDAPPSPSLSICCQLHFGDSSNGAAMNQQNTGRRIKNTFNRIAENAATIG